MAHFTRRMTLALLASAGVAPKAMAQDKARIAFLLPQSPDQSGWSFEHARGIDLAQQAHGDAVSLERFAPVSPEEAVALVQDLASKGYKAIFGCDSTYTQAIMMASSANPEVKFEHCGGIIRTPNIATYAARSYEGRTIEGLLAANVSRSGKIGYIASRPQPDVIRGINAAYLAARSVNPDISFEVSWLNTTFDPALEKGAALHLADNGADVFMQHSYSPAAVMVAEELGLHAIGSSTDMAQHGPNAHLMATVNTWGPYYTKRVGQILDGTWEAEETWAGLKEGMIEISPLNGTIPNRAVNDAEAAIEGFKSGTHHAFAGPINYQNGSAWLADGEQASDSQLRKMNFFVEGLTSIIPS